MKKDFKIYTFFTTTKDKNLAFHVNDDKQMVLQNHEKLLKKIGFEKESLIYMNQVHGNNVEIVDRNSNNVINNCDGIITKEKNLVLMVMVADCIPILFKDKRKGVIAAVHAGRNSTLQKIVEVTVNKMIKEFSCDILDIEVIMGPSIQKCCYEVDEKLSNIVRHSFGSKFVINRNLDLQGINESLLKKMGIKKISISNVCTLCSNEEYYSYRKNKKCGRFAGLIYLS